MRAFLSGRACSDTLFHVLNRAHGHPLPAEEQAACFLAGGILQHGCQCGMIWGAALAAGAQAHRQFGPGPLAHARALHAAQRLAQAFHGLNAATDCADITHLGASATNAHLAAYFLLKGGIVRCMRMAAAYAPVARREIGMAMGQGRDDAPRGPVSCAALLAQRMGASEAHQSMAAGLAGGIGLSGGGCGALGAALWLIGLQLLARESRQLDFKSPAARQALDRFLECTGRELECASIVGRTFAGPDDHAEHLRSGGCADILAALAQGLEA